MIKQNRRGLLLLWDLAAPLLLYMVISDMTLYACQLLGRGITAEQVLPVNAMGAALAAIPLGSWYREKRRERSCLTEQEEKHPDVRNDLIPIIFLAAASCVFFNNLLISFHIPFYGFDRAEEILYRPSLPVQLVCTGLVIPFAEELVFRGLVYERLRRELPVRGAVLVSSAYFGIFHGNPAQGIYAAILGCMMAALYERYGTLAAAWLFHAAANLTSVLINARAPNWNTAVTAVCGILILGSIYKIKKGKETA